MKTPDLKKIKYVYLVGAGGIGMSALGLYFKNLGCQIFGYDKTGSEFLGKLIKEGFKIQYRDSVDEIPMEFINASEDEKLVIYTPAVSNDSSILKFFSEKGFPTLKRAIALGLVTQNSKNISVAGTHGKTTTTAFLAHIYKYAGLNPTAFVGGILKEVETNFFFGDPSLTITEADEFDRSFLQLNPSIAVITSTESDHLDIYLNFENLKEAFKKFIWQIKKPGYLLIHENAARTLDLNREYYPDLEIKTYGISDQADFRVIEKGYGEFRIENSGQVIIDAYQPMPGLHNTMNAAAAAIVAYVDGIDSKKIIAACKTFPGLHRRLEKILETPQLLFYDDYAHHPTEIESCIMALRKLAGYRKITGVFQPHLYSRTRDFADEFSKALDLLDNIILLPIYPAREPPIPGVDSRLIFDKLKSKNKFLCNKDELLSTLKNLNPRGFLVTIGAGDIDKQVPLIKNWILNEKV